MQKVSLIPRMPQLQEAFFLSRLLVFNETFASMRKVDNHVCIVWHEAMAGRRAEEVTCTFLKFFNQHRDVENIILWLDNCTGQNKNWLLFSTILSYVNDPLNSCNSIVLNYLLTGHTYMAADGLHGKIEQMFRKMGDVQDFNDFITGCKQASRRMDVIDMKLSDFYQHQTKIKTGKASGMPNLREIVSLKFLRGETEIFYKTDFRAEEYLRTGIIKKNATIILNKNSISTPRGLKDDKKIAIIEQLVPKMKPSRREFWMTLPENVNAEDLIEEI